MTFRLYYFALSCKVSCNLTLSEWPGHHFYINLLLIINVVLKRRRIKKLQNALSHLHFRFSSLQPLPKRALNAQTNSASTRITFLATNTGSATTMWPSWRPAAMDLPSMPQTTNTSQKTATTSITWTAATDPNLVSYKLIRSLHFAQLSANNAISGHGWTQSLNNYVCLCLF